MVGPGRVKQCIQSTGLAFLPVLAWIQARDILLDGKKIVSPFAAMAQTGDGPLHLVRRAILAVIPGAALKGVTGKQIGF